MFSSRQRRAKSFEEAEPFLGDDAPEHRPQTGTKRSSTWLNALPWHLLCTPVPRRRQLLRSAILFVVWLSTVVVFLILLVGIFFPSYTHPPAHYRELEARAKSSELPGRANPAGEKIFIAASIYDAGGELLSGTWADAVLDLIDLLGPKNVFLSVYENDPDELARKAASNFRQRVRCNSSIVTEDLDPQSLPHVTFNSGTRILKRIPFLAQVRNSALDPLQTHPITFDKIFYINDVLFEPLSAAQLLFSTNLDPATGKSSYLAACAVDFINPFKFYDTYATRDLEGNRMGVPFYPWFSNAGAARSRRDVLEQSDAVRVKSCWGGMIAFDAKYFQQSQASPGTALTFRSTAETYWEASECCLIHADLALAANRTDPSPTADLGIYMNPYIRVTYDVWTWSRLVWVQRPERLYAVLQSLLTWGAGLPFYNPRRLERPGEVVKDQWVWDNNAMLGASGFSVNQEDAKGVWRKIDRIAASGGFCGMRQLAISTSAPGGPRWGTAPIPAFPGGETEN